uniref:Genome polyprotein n=1 Tax=Darwin bee virus 2 TaxID=2201277 RepID=A0A2U8JQ75_9VIRU|nr:polyprotein [Darwin bee virus 2]
MYEEIEAQYYNVYDQSGIRTSNSSRGCRSIVSQPSQRKEDYPSRSSLMAKGVKRLGNILTTSHKKFNQVVSYTDLLNSWLSGMFPVKNITRNEMYVDDCGRRGWTVYRYIEFSTAEGAVVHTAKDHSLSLRVSQEETARVVLSNYYIANTQSDEVPSKESIQGDATQHSDKENNTIVTRDQQQTIAEPDGSINTSQIAIASSEPTHRFPTLVGRWMPVNVLKISTTADRGEFVATYYLPETFLSDQARCAPNTIPFETFVYGQYDMAMKFVVNANKFHCGKVIVSIKFDSYQADDINHGFQAALSRPHIILDLSANNEGTIDIPFRYHRAFVRNQTHSTATVGVRPGKYASVYVQILSPLRSAPGGAQDMDIRPYYMYKRAEFAGMSYKVALTQMDVVEDLVNALPTKALKSLLVGVEKSLDQLGKSNNQDKPTTLASTVVIPRPRLCFPHGKGISDAIPMRMNPAALTSYTAIQPFPDDPKTTLEIARIWGLRSVFTWKSTINEGEELFNAIIDPTSRSYTSTYNGEPTPLEYVSSFYNFWSGPIELRFDFVSNSFHTGAVLISAEFNRTSAQTDECQSYSTYTKTFHLGDQKSVTFTIPYIYDTIMRRSTSLAYCPIVDKDVATNDDIKSTAISIRAESKMRVKVRVINALRPVASAPQEIEVLCFMRGGKNFMLHGLCQSSFWDSRDIVPIDSFPSDNYLPTRPADRSKRSPLTEEEQRIQEHRYLPKAISNKWNELSTVPRTPKTQMDTGEKEDEDPTDNFSQGISAMGAQSLDSQVGIKDILRRPVLLFDRIKIEATDTGFFIPLMPPSRMMQYDRTNKQTTLYQNLVGVTPQAAIMNLFRFWRGSMRYTIILHDGSAAPVYITHVPHTGIRKFGTIKINGADNSKKTPIFGCGLTTEVLIPVVNPTVCIEAPFDTENNWCLTFDEDALRNYAWRDKGDTVSGHLVVSTVKTATVSIWWSAGDDFEVANFYGIPAVISNHWQYQFSDEHARVQSDEMEVVTDPEVISYHADGSRTIGEQGFQVKNVSTAVETLWKGIKKVTTPERVVNTAVCMLPGVGTAYATATLLDTVGSGINTTMQLSHKVTDNLNTKIEQLASKLGTSMDYITNMVQETVSKALGTFHNATTYATYCFDVVLDILVAWIDKSWTAIGVGIIRFVTKVLGVKMVTSLMEQAVALGHSIAIFMRPEHAHTQAPPEKSATIVGILAGIIGTIMGVKISPTYGRSFYDSMLIRLTETRGVSYLMVMLKFVEATFTTIKDMIMHALGYVSPEHAALKMLSGSSQILEKFITDAQLVTTEANSMLVQDPGFRYRFWSTVMQAYQIQKLLATVPTANASPVLSRLCTEVIKISNEKFVDISASPVRYEPFVICIEGAAGIGKSELVESLVTKLLNGISLQRPHSGATYFRMPGSRFWSGYRDQPVVAYDDWANLTDPTLLAQQVSELYQLKSTSTFIPEMAHLEEKKIRGNPLIVILLCNEAFPQNALSSLAHTPEAIYRRRDVLLRASRKVEYLNTSLRDMTVEDQTTFAHLEFLKYVNPAIKETLGKTKVSYSDASNFLVSKFQRWHAQEQIKVKRRLDNIRAGMMDTGIDSIRLEDPFQLYYSVSTNLAMTTDLPTTGFLPSEVLAAEVRRIATTLENYQHVEQEITIPPEPSDPFIANVQADYNWRDISRVVSIGIMTSRVSLEQIAKASSTVLSKLLDQLVSQHLPVKECSICMESKSVEWYCLQAEETQGSDNNTHYVCRECITSSQNVGAPILACPVCRSSRFERWRVEEKFVAMSLLARTSIKCLLSVDEIVNKAIKLFSLNGNSSFPYVMSSIFRMGVSIVAGATGFIPYDFIRGPIAVGALVDAFTIPLEDVSRPNTVTPVPSGVETSFLPSEQIVTVQMDNDDPFGEGPSGLAQWEIEDIYDKKTDAILTCRVSPKRLHELLSNGIDGEHPCLHHLLKDSEHAIKFSEGKFILPLNGTMLYIPERLCATNCYFKDAIMLGTFYKELLEHHGHVYNRSILGYINAPENKNYHRNKIPEALRPEWMFPREDLQQEISIITSDSWWERIDGVWSNYKYVILAVGGVITAIGGIMALNRLFADVPHAMVEYVQSGDELTRNLKSTTRALQRVRTVRPHFQNVQDQPELDSVVKQYVARNYVTIALYKPKGIILMTACGIYGHQAILPRHYVKAMRKSFEAGYKIEAGPALFKHEWKEYTFDSRDFITSDTTDIALWNLPASFGMFKDIRKFIATDDDLSHPITTEGCIFLAPTRLNPVLKEQTLEILGLQNSQSVEDSDGEFFEAHDVLCYNYSQPGACGSLVMIARTQRPIVAMHFAGLGPLGTAGEGFGVVLTKETLGDIMEAKSAVTQLEDWDGLSLEEARIILEDTNVHYIGALDKHQTPFAPKKSKIRPSLIQGVNGLQPLTEPCILDKTDKRYTHEDTPLVAGCKKHGQMTKDFPTSLIEKAAQGLWDGWISKMKPLVVAPCKLTPQQAATGYPNIEYYDPMILNTSAGFPYVTTKKKAKSDYIEFVCNEQKQPINAIIEDSLLNEISRKEKLRREGIQPITPFIDTLKDERKKKEKIQKYGSTRVFCNPPVDYVVSMRQNFLHFTSSFMKYRMSLMHAVGINLTGTEWTALANKLIDKSFNNISTIDYSNFGPGFNAHVASYALDLMVRWTMENVAGVNETELRVLLHECLNSVHICHNTVYQQKCGSPSGAPITVVINTLVNLLYIMIAWDKLTEQQRKKEDNTFVWEEFKKSVSIFCYGDDLIMSVVDKWKDVFNTITITSFFSEYGIVATDASKSEEKVANTPLTSATFLKHGFRRHEVHQHIWQSCLDWTSINDCTQWIWECANLKIATRENCEAALLQAHGHGSKIFNTFKEQINGALRKRKIDPLTITWEEVDSKFYPELLY